VEALQTFQQNPMIFAAHGEVGAGLRYRGGMAERQHAIHRIKQQRAVGSQHCHGCSANQLRMLKSRWASPACRRSTDFASFVTNTTC
jgi:hypothetical protein